MLARYLVDASGLMGANAVSFLSRRTFVDRLIGVARRFTCVSRSHYMLIEAVDDGWFYSAHLPDGGFVTVYFTDADIYSHGRKAQGDYWRYQVQKTSHTQERLRDSV